MSIVFYKSTIRNDTKLNIYKNVAMCCMLCYKIDPIIDLSHIYSSTKNGPRSYKNYDNVKNNDPNILFNDENNILVLCPSCHRKIDYKNGANYSPEELLQAREIYMNNFNKIYKKPFYINICSIILPTITITTGILYYILSI